GSSTTPYTVYIDGSAQETAAISVGGNGGGSTARKVQIKRYGSGTAGFGRKDEHTPSGTLLTVEKDSELTLNGITLDGKNIALAADEIVTRGNTVFEGCTVQNYTAETKRVLYVENGNCMISNTVMQGAASLTPQGYVYVNKTAAESPVFTVKGSVKIGGAGDLTSVILGCYEDSSHNWNSVFVNADGLNAGSYINLVPSKYDKQSGKTLVKGSGASSYKDYFHIAGNSDDGGHYLLEAGDDGGINNALILKKSIIISGGDENAWAKLKYNAERANDGEVIVVTGTIKASNSTATINSTSVNNFGDIVITKKVTIRAKDETGAVIDANKKDGGKTAHRIFKADGTGAELTLQNIKLQGGIAEGGQEIVFGGAVYVRDRAALVLDKCVVTDNSAWRGGGIYIAEDSKFEAKNGCKILQNKAVYDTSMSYSGLGGGVSTSKSEKIELSNAELNDNTAEQSGGAICIYGAKSFKIENCTIKQNKAKRYGAGVFCDDNYAPITAEITNSAIENNELDQNLEQDSSGTYGGAGISFTGIGTGRTLTISGGSIKNNKAYKLYGGGIRAGIATVTIKDNVNISGNTAEKGGGVYSIISGTFNMESGTISGNKAVTGGGVFLSGTFNMSGGIISGNEAKKSDTEYGDGGGVYIDGTSGQLNMKGGSLIQPSADKLAGKNDVYIGENKFIQLTGALTNSSNVVANLTSGSYDSDKTLVKWSGAGDNMEGYKARFALTENGKTWSLILSTDKKSLILKPKNETKLIDGDNGGTWAQLKNAVEGAEANAEILVKGTIKASLSTDSEIEVSKPVTIKPKGANAVLDADNHCRIFKITGSGKLTLQKDSSNKITLKNGKADKGGAVLVETGRVFTAHNVTVENCETSVEGGGAVYVENAGEFTAYDLNISGCKAGGSGGAIFTENNTTVTVSNGKLSSCTAGGNGGAIVNGGALNISSITFESNEAKGSNSYGGAIYSDGTSSVTASGCTFGGTEGNKAQNGGAAAIVGNSENAVVFTSCIFQKNTAAGSHGGAIFAERAITVK
ncbi:MAG: right-handed parallel beta-helix repeat-containing protein, partial [Treponema sp.]